MDQLRQAEAEHEGADTAGAAKRIRAKSPFVDLMFPAAKRQRAPCNRCGEEVDNASCQPDSTKEDSDLWKCRACNSKLVRLCKEHGTKWPTDDFKEFNDDEKRDFYKNVKGVKGPKKLAKFKNEKLHFRRVHSYQYQPLSYWSARGYDAQAIEQNCKDTVDHDILGKCYCIDITFYQGEDITFYQEEKAFDENVKHAEKVHMMLEPLHEELTALCAHPAVWQDSSMVAGMVVEDVMNIEEKLNSAKQALADGDFSDIRDMAFVKGLVKEARESVKLLERIVALADKPAPANKAMKAIQMT